MRIILFLSFILLTFFSCSKKLDFDQTQDFEAFPVVEADMFYMDLYADNLIDNQGNFRQLVSDTLDFSIFKEAKTREQFLRTEIFIKYSNSFQRRFFTQVFYIDENHQIVEQDTLDIQPASPAIVEGENIYEYSKSLNPNFVNFRKIVVKIEISPTDIPVEDKHLHIQAKGKYYLRIH